HRPADRGRGDRPRQRPRLRDDVHARRRPGAPRGDRRIPWAVGGARGPPAAPEATGEFLGLWRLIGDLGATGGPVVVGGIADLVGLGAAALALAGIGALS